MLQRGDFMQITEKEKLSYTLCHRNVREDEVLVCYNCGNTVMASELDGKNCPVCGYCILCG